MTIYYSATTNAFYDTQVYNVNNIPEDKVAVAESTYKNLMAQQCAGRVIVAAADGTPTTIAQTCGSCTSTKYATKTELTNGLAGKANDNAVVHKSGNETINGVKSFGDIIKATNGTVQVGADTGYSVTFNHNGNITSKQARGTYNIFFPEGSGTLALTSDIDGKANDNNVVHKTGDETISGTKIFLNDIFRKNTSADLTVTPTGYTNTNIIFTDKNDKTLAHIEYVQRPSGVNDVGIFARDKNNGSHGIHINTNNEVIPLISSSESYSLGSATYKWANVYSNRISFSSGYYMTTDAHDNSLRIIRDGSNHGNNYKIIIQGDTGKIFAPNGFIGNLQGNADTATKASYLDNYSLPGGNKIYLDWDKQVESYVGLKVDNTVMGGLITTKNIGSQSVKYATTAGSANSVAWANVTGKPSIPTTPNVYVTATWRSGSNWYRKWSNGFIEQGGTVWNSGAWETINLHLAFSNTNYQVTTGTYHDIADQNGLVTLCGKTTTSFQAGSKWDLGFKPTYVDWYACGY